WFCVHPWPGAGTPASGPKTTGGHDAVGMAPAVLRYNVRLHPPARVRREQRRYRANHNAGLAADLYRAERGSGGSRC
ncbi:MAG: hypothetical protein JXA14_14860, partial [Anaerolineae bacterium]|nr:hypothetical protein [Anaerolineae bacterium]